MGFLIDFCSVIILAFVKSDGKASTASQIEGSEGKVSERSALLGERTASLEGSLGDRVVSVSASPKASFIPLSEGVLF